MHIPEKKNKVIDNESEHGSVSNKMRNLMDTNSFRSIPSLP